MHQRPRAKLSALLALTLMLILSSCGLGGKSASSGTEVVFWQPDVATWQPVYQKLANMFMEKHPDIKVKVVNIPEEGYTEKLNTAFAANRGPDMWVGLYAVDEYERGYIQALDEYIKKDNWDMNQYFQPAVDNRAKGTDGKYYGLPRDISMSVVLYNKDLFDKYGVAYPKAGWTMDDYVATAKKLSHPNDKVYGTDMTHELFESPLPWNNGVDTLSDDGWTAKGYLDSPEMVKYMNTIQGMVKDGSVVPSKILDTLSGEYPAFTAGTAAMSHGSLWGYNTLKETKFNWGVAPYPTNGGKDYSWVDAVPYHMNARSKQKDATWEFMKFMSGPEAGKEIMKTMPWASPSKEAWKGLENDERLSVFYNEGTKNAKRANYLRNGEAFQQTWGGLIEAAMTDMLQPLNNKPMADPATRLKKAATDVQAELDKAKSKRQK